MTCPSYSYPIPLLLCLGLSIWMSLLTLTTSLTCTSQKLSNNHLYSNCLDLPVLNSYLHWTHHSSNSSLSIAFVATPAKLGGWVSWAINPTGTGMAGAQALVGFKNDVGVMTAKTFNISSYSSIIPGKLSFEVWDLRAEESSGGTMSIFATVKVPEEAQSLNHVWQVGPSLTGGRLDKHAFSAPNLNSKGTFSFKLGAHSGGVGVDSRTKWKNIHGLLNAVSWGFLFPAGVIIARYMRVFPSLDPAWFYLHVSCQLGAYAIGLIGWATGLKLGAQSQGIQYSPHRNIGLSLFFLATIQIFALFLRPKKDHKYRLFWNIYHHSIGYAIIILGIMNIFMGFEILNPDDNKWKSAYIAVIAALCAIALLEMITWIVVLRRKSSKSSNPDDE